MLFVLEVYLFLLFLKLHFGGDHFFILINSIKSLVMLVWQDEPNPAQWLSTRAGNMGCITTCIPQIRKIASCISCNKSFLTKLARKMAGYWPRIPNDLGWFPAILNVQARKITYTSGVTRRSNVHFYNGHRPLCFIWSNYRFRGLLPRHTSIQKPKWSVAVLQLHQHMRSTWSDDKRTRFIHSSREAVILRGLFLLILGGNNWHFAHTI